VSSSSGGGTTRSIQAQVQRQAECRREEIEVDKPLLTVDRQMGLVIIAPEGKVGKRVVVLVYIIDTYGDEAEMQEARTIFKRMSYDEKRDQSVVRCKLSLWLSSPDMALADVQVDLRRVEVSAD
jgi:hypothetical protein